MPAPDDYLKHSENVASATRGLTQAERAHKDAIRRSDSAATVFSARMHMMVVSMLAEARLRKILTEPGGFNDRERTLVSRARSQEDKWLQAVELAFRRQYQIPVHEDIGEPGHDQLMVGRFRTITNVLSNDLRVVIEDRNKIAHGQWTWLLNSKETGFSGRAAAPLNYRQTQRRNDVITALAAIVHALVVSEETFNRDFDTHYGQLVQAQQLLDGREYPELVRQLRDMQVRRVAAIRSSASK